jgi:hypothetical protein
LASNHQQQATSNMKNWKLIISLMIIGWLGLQLWTGVTFRDQTWPFIGFPMYAYKRGVTFDNEVQKIMLRGVTAAGQEVEVIPEDFGMYSTPWDNSVMPKLKDPTTNRGTAAQLAEDYNRRHPDRPALDGMKLIMIHWKMTETVPVEMPPDTLLYYVRSSSNM